jgi:hypothetical protein
MVMTDFLRADARMALARYESSVAAFGMEAGFPMKDVYAVKEYIERLETMLLKSADRIEKLEAALKPFLQLPIGVISSDPAEMEVYQCHGWPRDQFAVVTVADFQRVQKALEKKDD